MQKKAGILVLAGLLWLATGLLYFSGEGHSRSIFGRYGWLVNFAISAFCFFLAYRKNVTEPPA